MSLDQEALRRKNDELSFAYKEKNRKLLQTQELYDKLKRKAMLGHIQEAACDAVDTTLHGGPALGSHSLDHAENQPHYEQQYGAPYGASQYADGFHQQAAVPAQTRMAPPDIPNAAWARSAPAQGMYSYLKTH